MNKFRIEPSISYGTIILVITWVAWAGVYYKGTNDRLDANEKQQVRQQLELDSHETKIGDIKETLSAIKQSSEMMTDWMRRPADSQFKPSPPVIKNQ